MSYLFDFHIVNYENYFYILKLYKVIFIIQKKFLSVLLLSALALRCDMALFHISLNYKDHFPCW